MGMSNLSEPDARMATQTLLDIAIKANKRRNDAQSSGGSKASRGVGKEIQPAHSSPRLSLATVTPSGMGRIVTSGDFQNARPSSDSSGLVQRDLSSKGSYRQQIPPGPERVTVIVQRPSSPRDDTQQTQQPEGGMAATAEIPVPPSAFAPLKRSGDSGKSSADISPFSSTVMTGKDTDDEDAAANSDEGADFQNKNSVSKRPAKRQKMIRSVSINTVLQRVGSKEGPLGDVVGTAPQTVQDMVASPDQNPIARGQTVQTVRQGETLKLADNLIGNKLTHAMTPSIPPRRSSEQSTLDLHRQIALQDSSNTVETVMKARQGSDGLHRALSAERDLHNKASAASSGMAQANDMGTSLPQPQQQPGQLLSSKDGEELHKTAIWTGKVKHRLKIAEGASTVELFSVTALVPEKLLEQMPSTLFVSALAGRANVKLGKHYVTQCRLGDLVERQMQKVAALATMKLVAICELQHCTLTLVPFTDSSQCIRMVGFMIADD